MKKLVSTAVRVVDLLDDLKRAERLAEFRATFVTIFVLADLVVLALIAWLW